MEKSKRIGTFKEFLQEQQIKKINESRISLEVEWWDECILEVMQKLTDQCNGYLSYDNLVKFVKDKFLILGRPDPGYNESMLLQHIKDLIFEFHWNSLVLGGGNWEEDNTELQAKGLAISELSKVILDKVLDTIQTDDDPIPGQTTMSLVDKSTVEGDECCDDDLPFENKKVMKFNDYKKSLNETLGVGVIENTCYEKCIKYCLDRIKEEVGSFDPEEILKVATKAIDPLLRSRIVLFYVKAMVIDYLSSEKAQLAVVSGNDKKGKNLPKEAWEESLDKFYQEIADDVLVQLADINGFGLSDGKAE